MSGLNAHAIVVMLAAAVAGPACSVESVTIPGPFGPSELGLSLELTVSPDVISQDGVSTSRLNIVARGPNSQPVSGIPMRVDVLVPTDSGLVMADFGTLSDRWPSTGTDGRATVVYRAPPQPAATATSDTVITLQVTPVGSNHAGAVPRVVNVKLVRPGIIRAPTRMVPRFTYSPAGPREHDTIFFDAASSSDPDNHIVSYFWQFGDGSAGSGRQATHAYELAGTYGVTLTVTDAYGLSVSTPVTAVAVTTSAAPTAHFTLSPADPRIGTRVVFNAAASSPAPGRRIVDYSWDLGDNTFVQGAIVVHTYSVPGTYTVVLVVTDDGGRKGVVSQKVTVDDIDAPVASFTVSPTNPVPGTLVTFNAAASTVSFGRTIVSYEWDFGDGSAKGSGVMVTHTYLAEATYKVVLTVTDSAGRKSVTSGSVTVKVPSDAVVLTQSPMSD